MRMFVFALMVAVFSRKAGSSTIPPGAQQPPAPCHEDEVELMPCLMPLMFSGLVMSGQSPPFGSAPGAPDGNANISASFTEAKFQQLCGMAQLVGTCINAYAAQCNPETYSQIHILANGTSKLLKICREPNAYPKVLKVYECRKRMEEVFNRCDNSGPHDEMPPEMSMDFNNSAEEATARENFLRPRPPVRRQSILQDLCCGLKQLDTCVMPEVTKLCGQETYEVNTEFISRIYGSYGCHPRLITCPSNA